MLTCGRWVDEEGASTSSERRPVPDQDGDGSRPVSSGDDREWSSLSTNLPLICAALAHCLQANERVCQEAARADALAVRPFTALALS